MYRFEFLHFVAVVLLFHSPLSAQEHSSEAMKFQYFKQDKTRTQRIVIQHYARLGTRFCVNETSQSLEQPSSKNDTSR